MQDIFPVSHQRPQRNNHGDDAIVKFIQLLPKQFLVYPMHSGVLIYIVCSKLIWNH